LAQPTFLLALMLCSIRTYFTLLPPFLFMPVREDPPPPFIVAPKWVFTLFYMEKLSAEAAWLSFFGLPFAAVRGHGSIRSQRYFIFLLLDDPPCEKSLMSFFPPFKYRLSPLSGAGFV